MPLEQIRKERPTAADLLSLMSFFNPQEILETVLRAYTIRSTARVDDSISDGDDDDGSDFYDDLDILLAYSLVKTTANSELSEMHQLVQFCRGSGCRRSIRQSGGGGGSWR